MTAPALKAGLSTMERDARVHAIGGSDARIIMSGNGEAIERLWREKRGEIEPEDLSRVLAVQLGHATEDLNRAWFFAETGRLVTRVGHRVVSPKFPVMATTLDGWLADTETVFEAKFMLPFNWSEESALEKYYAQVQHNMVVTGARSAILSVITGGARYSAIQVEFDPLYAETMIAAERDFWRCVKTGARPAACPPPRTAKPAPTKVLDCTGRNDWANFAADFLAHADAAAKFEAAKTALKDLVPADVKEARGHGVVVKRNKAGSASVAATEA